MSLTPLVAIAALTVVAVGQGMHAVPSGQPGAGTRKPIAISSNRSYGRLFTTPMPSKEGKVVPLRVTPQAPTPKGSQQQPRIVCGMVVIPVTPDRDPKMLVEPKTAGKTEYKIRALEPRICRE